jgi:ribonuclease P protein component
VLHLAAAGDSTEPALVGFVVSRAVGPAVTRNRVRRRLREAVRARIGELPHGSLLVVRANPAAAAVPWPTLCQELDVVLNRVLPSYVAPVVEPGAGGRVPPPRHLHGGAQERG